MRFAARLIGMNLFLWAANAAPPSEQVLKFGTGSLVGLCMSVKCEVFRGVIVTDALTPGEPVTVRVEEGLFGTQPTTRTVDLPHPHEMRDSNLAAAWSTVKITRGLSVTAVVTLQNGLAGIAGNPVIVTSDERREEIIRSMTEEEVLLNRSPQLVSDAVASLSQDPNPALAGYLLSRLIYRTNASQPELVCGLLLQMLPNPSVPTEILESIASELSRLYFRVSDASRADVLRRFTDLGEQTDVPSAKAAYAGLAHIATYDESVKTRIPPATLIALANVYRAMVKNGSIPRNTALETGLGVKGQ